MSYAVIKTGGKQYRVEEGQTLLVEKLPDEPGATVELRPAAAGGRRRRRCSTPTSWPSRP